PLDVNIDDFAVQPWDSEEIKKLFGFLEFRTLYDRLVEATGQPGAATTTPTSQGEAVEVDVRRVTDAAAAIALLNSIGAAPDPLAMVAAWEGAEGRTAIEGLAISGGKGTEADWVDGSLLDDADVIAALNRLLDSERGIDVNAHHAKELMRGLDHYG